MPTRLRLVTLAASAVLFVQCSGESNPSGDRGSAGVPTGSPTSGPSGSTPAAKALTVADLPDPVVFDRSTRLQFDDDPKNPIFNLTRGTIDLMFSPSASQELAGSEEGEFHQALISCADEGAAATRYGVFLLGDLDGFGFWDGTDFYRIEHELEPDVWTHLAIVFAGDWTLFAVDGEPIGALRARPGRPIDPSDASGKRLRICKTCIGGTITGEDGFQGRIAWVRTFRAPLSMADIARLAAIVGVPADPVLAQCLAMSSNWQESSSSLQVSSIENRLALADQARGSKLQQPFAKDTAWLFDLDTARQRAKEKGQRILAWCTRGDAYDPACLALESGLLDEPWWATMQQDHVPLLLVADTKNPSPLGVSAGECAFFDADGKLLRRLVPWSAEFVQGIRERLTALAAEQNTDATRARTILLQPAARIPAAELAEVSALVKKPGIDEDLTIRAEHAARVRAILELQTRFQRGEAIAEAGGLPVAFADAAYLYEAEALRLFGELVLPLEPQPELVDYAILLWRGFVEDPRLELATDVANFVVPMRSLDVAVDAAVGALALELELDAEAVTDLEAAQRGR